MRSAPALFKPHHRSETFDAMRLRGGIAKLKLLAILATVVVGGTGVWWKFAPAAWSAASQKPITGQVVVAEFVHEIVERGDIQSSANVEVRSEVQLRNNSYNSGVAILEIVPEGTFVGEGDFLVRLDDSSLQNDLTLQQIDCNASYAVVVQAETAVETAKLALSEYESGTFKQSEEQLQSEIFVAKENYRRAEEYVRYSERLAAKGYVTPIQLEADRFAVDKAKKELEVAETKMEVLRTYTKQKTLKQLEADVKTAEAKLEAARENHSVETARLERIKQQIAKCIITAPKAGQVVYANDQVGQNAESVLIEEGRLVRERQVIIRLPNPKQMQVVAKINESRIDLVRPGMEATVKVDALPDVQLRGRVKKVSEYPMSQSSAFTSHIKEYATEIDIIDPPPGLRPGMTAQAAIVVEQRPEAAQVPLQAVMEHDGRFYCLTHGSAGIEAKQVQVGPTNDQFVVIEAGLRGNEQVLMTPKQFAERVTLPEPVEFPPRVASRPPRVHHELPPMQIAHTIDNDRPAKREPIRRAKAAADPQVGAGL